MRVTNQMITNNMLLSMSRNISAVDSLYTQVDTGKKIQLSSDNPIIASRALKFRTSVFETEQYLDNVNQGISWMEITEQAMSNVTDALESVKELAQEGASGSFNISNKQTFADQLQSILDRLGGEMNVTYAGRYVFSGYRTDKPPVMTETDTAARYAITQSFHASNIESATVYAQAGAAEMPVVTPVKRLKLPYTEVTDLTGLAIYDENGNFVETVPVETLADANAATTLGTDKAYSPNADKAYYIQETGEIILGETAAAKLMAHPKGRIDVAYTKTGLKKGDLNPEVYFDCRDLNSGKEYTMSGQDIQYEFGVNTRVTINNLAKDTVSATLYGDLKALIQTVNSVTLSTRSDLVAKYSGTYTGDELEEKIAQHQADEEQYYEGVLTETFSNMMSIIETHKDETAKEYTQLGSRMNRLELIQSRLQEDRLSYNTLKTENEDADYFESTMNLNAAVYVYQMSLKASAGMMQTSLADFIN